MTRRAGISIGGRAVTAAAVLAAAVVLSACQPEPGLSPSPTPTPTVTPVTPAPEPTTPTPIETNLPDAQLPAACEDIYSAEMLAVLNEEIPPLNDPGITMLSTENVDAIEILESGVPTLRCTWGLPSEYGLATNVTLVDAAQADTLWNSLLNTGFVCSEEERGGFTCDISQRGVDLDDHEYFTGEVHMVVDGIWVATRFLNYTPSPYVSDIAATLWG